jgi:hypothetical protein
MAPMQLYPHILFRTDAAASPAATILRCAGYVVTKVRGDAAAESLAAASHVDAIVVELPVVHAVSTARHGTLRGLPMLFLTAAPAALCNAAGSVATLHPADADDDLVTAVDLLIASTQASSAQAAAS